MLESGFRSRVLERSADGESVVIAHHGTLAEMRQLADSLEISQRTDLGFLKSLRLRQESPHLWCCECRYESDREGGYANAPDTAYGKKSATLHAAVRTLPLARHPAYRMCWDHQLIAAPGTSAVPSWWATATSEAITPESDERIYRWQKPGDTPIRTAVGHWHILKAPTKPGAETFDWATYTITERARFRSDRAAGRMIAGKLNQIGKPVTTFGITGGSWKCGDAGVGWNGRCWVATLSWSRSADDDGWDADLYPAEANQ